jgi:hypothetical protein
MAWREKKNARMTGATIVPLWTAMKKGPLW